MNTSRKIEILKKTGNYNILVENCFKRFGKNYDLMVNKIITNNSVSNIEFAIMCGDFDSLI